MVLNEKTLMCNNLLLLTTTTMETNIWYANIDWVVFGIYIKHIFDTETKKKIPMVAVFRKCSYNRYSDDSNVREYAKKCDKLAIDKYNQYIDHWYKIGCWNEVRKIQSTI